MKRKSLAIALILLIALGLVGCASKASEPSYARDRYDPAPTPMPAEAWEAEYGDAKFSALSGSGVGIPQSQKLIFTINLSIETLEYDQSVADIEALCAEYGGYMEYANVSGNGVNYSGLRSANYTLRIPAAALDSFQGACDGLGSVISATRETTNATSQYVDMQARLKSLETEETRLLELMEGANDLEALITLNQRLSQIRYEIESIESSLRGIDSLVSYSTVSIYLTEVVRPSEPRVVTVTFGQQLSAASSRAWRSFKDTMSDLGVFMFGKLPLALLTIIIFLLPFGVVALIVIAVVRAGNKRRAKAQRDKENQ